MENISVENRVKDSGKPVGGVITHRINGLLKPRIEQLLLPARLRDTYANITPGADPIRFLEEGFKSLNIGISISPRDLERIPAKGPVLVLANHPFGGVDGMALCYILLSARSDARIMANHYLGLMPALRPIFFLVDPFEGSKAVHGNLRALKEAIGHLKDGGMIGMFPSGEVAHFRLSDMKVAEQSWDPKIARIIRMTGASVLPMFFMGGNSPVFHLSGLLHPRLRTLLLPRELLKKVNSTIRVKIGSPVNARTLQRFASDADMMEYLRLRTYLLGKRDDMKKPRPRPVRRRQEPQPPAPVIEAQPKDYLVREVKALPEEQILMRAGNFSILLVDFQQAPRLMRELGRCRELTFRAVGEGTRKPVDLDCFDQYYKHLVLWNREKEEIAGAYRLGLTDVILENYGREGLYTSTLFRYKPAFLEHINPALELGRSFVCREYQRTYQPLLLLWKGISRFLALNPRYRMLFGPVSITSDYNVDSRRLIVAFLRENNHLTDLAELVKPNNPYQLKDRPIKAALPFIKDIRELGEMVSEMEKDEKGLPILVKQYLKLGGKFLGFGVDPNFNDALDALILVDLAETKPVILERYMGKEEAASFLACHQNDRAARCA